MTNEHFTEAELNLASTAGINQEALEIAKAYPTVGFGRELRKHLEWGNVSEMADHRREEKEEAQPAQFWLGGSFTTALAFGDLPTAYGRADRQNRRILYDQFPTRLQRATHVQDAVRADVENGDVLVYEDDPEEVPA